MLSHTAARPPCTFCYFRFKKVTDKVKAAAWRLETFTAAEAFHWRSDNDILVSKVEMIFLTDAELSHAAFKEISFRIAKGSLVRSTSGAVPYQMYPVAGDEGGSAVGVLLFEGTQHLPTLVIRRSPEGDEIYLSESIEIVEDSPHTAQLSGTVISCSHDRLAVVSLADVPLEGPGLVVGFTPEGRVNSYQDTTAEGLSEAIKAIPKK